ncbi:hypothetical protein F5880DRAFT_1546056 [Lentinula raphanica]|nr:hypothetical protein F5880DRAFT_1546056 [Lentinula raphanica]
MSACTITGIFTLTKGARVASPSRSSSMSTSFYWEYNTIIECGNLRTDTSSGGIPAVIKIYSPPQERSNSALANRTAAFVVGQFALSAPGQPALIDAFTLIPVPGDPGSAGYDDSLPWFYPFLSGVGTVLDNSPTGVQPRSFLLTVSEYVRGSSRTFNVRGVYDSDNGRGRWANTPLPTVGSSMFFHASCLASHNGNLELNIHSLNFGATLTAPTSTGSAPPGGPVLPTAGNSVQPATGGSSSPGSGARKRVRRTYADVTSALSAPTASSSMVAMLPQPPSAMSPAGSSPSVVLCYILQCF